MKGSYAHNTMPHVINIFITDSSSIYELYPEFTLNLLSTYIYFERTYIRLGARVFFRIKMPGMDIEIIF